MNLVDELDKAARRNLACAPEMIEKSLEFLAAREIERLRAQCDDLLEHAVWTPVSNPPSMTMGVYGWMMSDPVLGVTRHGAMQVVVYEQVDDDYEPTWKTVCSDWSDVTAELTHWMKLPRPPYA